MTTTAAKPKRGHAVRVNDRFQVDSTTFAQRLWEGTALRQLVQCGEFAGANQLCQADRDRLWGGSVLGLNPNIRIYRYSKGQFFDKHYDESNDVLVGNGDRGKTTWTLLVYLTSAATGCRGGETVFYPDKSQVAAGPTHIDPISVGLETGMALLHRHGADCMLHEGREVTEGEKWVIRSDLVVAR